MTVHVSGRIPWRDVRAGGRQEERIEPLAGCGPHICTHTYTPLHLSRALHRSVHLSHASPPLHHTPCSESAMTGVLPLALTVIVLPPSPPCLILLAQTKVLPARQSHRYGRASAYSLCVYSDRV